MKTNQGGYVKRLLFSAVVIFGLLLATASGPAGASISPTQHKAHLDSFVVHCNIQTYPPTIDFSVLYGPLVDAETKTECNAVTAISQYGQLTEYANPRVLGGGGNSYFVGSTLVTNAYAPCTDEYGFIDWYFQSFSIMTWQANGVWQPTVSSATALTPVLGCGWIP